MNTLQMELIWQQELQDIDSMFENMLDFRIIWNSLRKTFDWFLQESSQLIENNVLNKSNKEIQSINGLTQQLTKSLWFEKQGYFISFFRKAIQNEIKINHYEIEIQLSEIFTKFDTTYTNLVNSIAKQNEFIEKISNIINVLKKYKTIFEKKQKDLIIKMNKEKEQRIIHLNKERFFDQMEVLNKTFPILIWNLQRSEITLWMIKDNSLKLKDRMEYQRPRIKDIIKAMLTEISHQKLLKMQIDAHKTMGNIAKQIESQMENNSNKEQLEALKQNLTEIYELSNRSLIDFKDNSAENTVKLLISMGEQMEK